MDKKIITIWAKDYILQGIWFVCLTYEPVGNWYCDNNCQYLLEN